MNSEQLVRRDRHTMLRDAILTHPTIAEGLTVLFANEPIPSGNAR